MTSAQFQRFVKSLPPRLAQFAEEHIPLLKCSTMESFLHYCADSCVRNAEYGSEDFWLNRANHWRLLASALQTFLNAENDLSKEGNENCLCSTPV